MIRIERAAAEDLPVIGDLARLIWRTSFPGIISVPQIEYMLAQRYSMEAMTEAAQSGNLIYELLRVDGDPRAFAAHGPTDDRDQWKLQQLYVHPDHQGRGLGGLLLLHIERTARELGKRVLVLTVNRHNSRARIAYERRGFRVYGEAKIDIGNGYVMDDFLMEMGLAT